MERRTIWGTIWGTMKRRKIDLEQGWDDIQKGITKLKAIVEGSGDRFTYEEYMKLYTTIYNMCNQKKPQWDDYCQRLYEMYKKALEEYINAMVYEEVKGEATDAVNVLIDKEREGEQINRELLKDVLNIYVQIGMGVMNRYEEDFEKHMLEDTSAYYSRKAPKWILEDSCPDYMLKCEECLKKERDRASNFLHSSTKPKLIETVQHELLVVLEKEHSGSAHC